MVKPKICCDCCLCGWNPNMEEYECHHEKAVRVDLVTGYVSYRTCEWVRDDGCGTDGKWFMAKKEIEATK
jgi:hypothetical protein